MKKLLPAITLLLAPLSAHAVLYPMQDATTVLCFMQDRTMDRVLMPAPISKIAELCTDDQAAGYALGPKWYDADTGDVLPGHWEHSVFVKEAPPSVERWQYNGRGGFQKWKP
jgi:hypothetical protein